MVIVKKWRWFADSDGTWVAVCMDQRDAKKVLSGLTEGRAYELSLKEHRKKRSMNANAYFWTLVDALAEVLGESPRDVYRSYIPDIGGNSSVVTVQADLVEDLGRMWCEGHDGRMYVDMGESWTNPGYHDVRVYKGSSDYNSQQMSRLIDLVIEDCKAQGIDTVSDKEKQAMLEAWAEGR